MADRRVVLHTQAILVGIPQKVNIGLGNSFIVISYWVIRWASYDRYMWRQLRHCDDDIHATVDGMKWLAMKYFPPF